LDQSASFAAYNFPIHFQRVHHGLFFDMCRHRNSSLTFVFFRRADRKERRNVLGGKAVTGAIGVWLNVSFCVKGIFEKSLWESAEIAPVYACFSPVRPAGPEVFLQPLVVAQSHDNYMLCFSFFCRLVPIRHIFPLCCILSPAWEGFTDAEPR
jgi:hypothetical protein